jgi:hypothetical protein
MNAIHIEQKDEQAEQVNAQALREQMLAELERQHREVTLRLERNNLLRQFEQGSAIQRIGLG